MRSKVRAYSHQGHGPRADQQAGYISASPLPPPHLRRAAGPYIRGKLGNLAVIQRMTASQCSADDDRPQARLPQRAVSGHSSGSDRIGRALVKPTFKARALTFLPVSQSLGETSEKGASV